MNLLIIQFCNNYSLNLRSALRRRPDIYRPPDIQTLNFFRVFRYDY